MRVDDARTRALLITFAACACLSGFGRPAAAAEVWPSFRGPGASGLSEVEAPLRWDVVSGENVAWRTPVPGLGHSSPAVWGPRLFITTAVRQAGEAELKVGLYGDIAPVQDDSPHAWRVYALDRATGKVLWERTVREGVPKVKRHLKSSHASPSPAADERHLVAFFGSEGLYSYDHDGKLLWEKDLGVLDSGFFAVPQAQWGFGSSPVIHGGLVIVQCDVQRGSFLAAFAVEDGSERWRTPRDDVPSWSTPTVVPTPGGAQVVVNGFRHIGGYDLLSGKPIWWMRGGGDIPVPTPVAAHGLVFITNAHGGKSPVYAVKAGASGDITLPADATASEHVAWSVPTGGNYMQTPIVAGDELYSMKDNGVLTCWDARTGEVHYRERVGSRTSGFTASPVAAAGRLYFASEVGEVHVVKAGKSFEVLATNDLGEPCMATPALAAGTIYFRTRSHVTAVTAVERRPTAAERFRFRHSFVDRDLPGVEYGQTSLADIDRDGDLDFVTGRRGGEVFWFEFRGAEGWRRHVIGGDQPSDVGGAAFDIDRDGWIDHAAGGVWYRSPQSPHDGEFTRHVFDAELRAVHDLVPADLDGDGRLDAVTMSDRNDLRWYRIPADPTQPWERRTVGPAVHAGVAAGDLDGDGDLDLVRSDRWFENADGKGERWTERPGIPFGRLTGPFPLATRCVVVDLDRDGDRDLVMTENEVRGGRIGWIENLDGKGGGWKLRELAAGDAAVRGAYHSLQVADFDLDGDSDIFTCEMEHIAGDRQPRWFIWENADGRGQDLRERVVLDAGLGGHEIVAGDVDGDGDIDLCGKLWRPRQDNANGGRNHADFLENLARE
jgi:outer membrane protein assembly factor BamB